jgi:hypothetical protein
LIQPPFDPVPTFAITMHLLQTGYSATAYSTLELLFNKEGKRVSTHTPADSPRPVSMSRK